MEYPHKCPKCDGTGKLKFNPLDPYTVTFSVSLWDCDCCSNGIVFTNSDGCDITKKKFNMYEGYQQEIERLKAELDKAQQEHINSVHAMGMELAEVKGDLRIANTELVKVRGEVADMCLQRIEEAETIDDAYTDVKALWYEYSTNPEQDKEDNFMAEYDFNEEGDK